MKDFLQKLIYPEDIKSPWKLKYSVSDVSSSADKEVVKVTKEDVKPVTTIKQSDKSSTLRQTVIKEA